MSDVYFDPITMDDEDDDEEASWSQPAYHDGFLRIMAEKCSTCIFRPGNQMRLGPGRVASMLESIRRDDSFVNCHKTLGTGQPGAVCRGGDDAHESQIARIARRLGVVKEVTEAEILEEGERYVARSSS